jgi:hypothetical protein
MSTFNPVELAQQYVTLSNSHDLGATMKMFALDAQYHSAFVGRLSGKSMIEEMMQGYFASTPDVNWSTNNYQLITPSIVRFSFRMTGTNKETGSPVERADIEEIEFNDEGLISAITVGRSLVIS